MMFIHGRRTAIAAGFDGGDIAAGSGGVHTWGNWHQAIYAGPKYHALARTDRIKRRKLALLVGTPAHANGLLARANDEATKAETGSESHPGAIGQPALLLRRKEA